MEALINHISFTALGFYGLYHKRFYVSENTITFTINFSVQTFIVMLLNHAFTTPATNLTKSGICVTGSVTTRKEKIFTLRRDQHFLV